MPVALMLRRWASYSEMVWSRPGEEAWASGTAASRAVSSAMAAMGWGRGARIVDLVVAEETSLR
jgi:hypothetical protein